MYMYMYINNCVDAELRSLAEVLEVKNVENYQNGGVRRGGGGAAAADYCIIFCIIFCIILSITSNS